MKKVSKLLIMILVGTLLVTGCKDKEDNKETKKDTVATRIVEVFEQKIKEEKDIEKVANASSTDEKMEIGVGVMEAEEGLLDGFDGEIKGFKKGYAIKPMISSQPFIAYIFETDDAASLKETLSSSANKRWNICTEADELEISVVDNYVFLIMSPTSFEE